METALEQILTGSYKADLIYYMHVHPEDFKELIKLAISNKKLYSWPAAWLLWSVMEDNDIRIQKHLKNILCNLASRNDDHLRELLIILQKMELDDEIEGVLFNICVTVWEKIDKKPSVRFNALKMIVKIAQKHPGLSHEVFLLSQNHYLDSLSPAVRRSISRMTKNLISK
jgi:hypothetical protein